jgi:hypothetical protein
MMPTHQMLGMLGGVWESKQQQGLAPILKHGHGKKSTPQVLKMSSFHTYTLIRTPYPPKGMATVAEAPNSRVRQSR